MKQQFDDQVKNAFDSNNYPMDKANWEQMAAIIDAQKPEKRRKFLWLFLLLIPAGIGGYFLVSGLESNEVVTANEVVFIERDDLQSASKDEVNAKIAKDELALNQQNKTDLPQGNLNAIEGSETKNETAKQNNTIKSNQKQGEQAIKDNANKKIVKVNGRTAVANNIAKQEKTTAEEKIAAKSSSKTIGAHKLPKKNSSKPLVVKNNEPITLVKKTNSISNPIILKSADVETSTKTQTNNVVKKELPIFIDPIGLKLLSSYAFNQSLLETRTLVDKNEPKNKAKVASSWSLTPQVGISLGKWMVDADNAIADTLQTLYSNEGLSGYQIGATLKYHFGNNFLIGAGLLYSANRYNYNHSFYNVDSVKNVSYSFMTYTVIVHNYKISRSSTFTVQVDSTIVEDSTAIVNYTLVQEPVKQNPIKINQVSMPIFIGVERSLGENWNTQFFTGPILNYVIKAEGVLPQKELKVYNNNWTNTTKTFKIDYAIHATINRKLGKNGALSFNPSYILALDNDNKNYHIRTKSNKFWFNLGYEIKF